MPLKKTGGAGSGLTVKLYERHGTGSYSTTTRPVSTEAATLSGTAPMSSSYTNTVWSCSGSGCDLDANTTYFIVANRTGSANYAWKRGRNTETETKSPSNNGWNIRWGA